MFVIEKQVNKNVIFYFKICIVWNSNGNIIKLC